MKKQKTYTIGSVEGTGRTLAEAKQHALAEIERRLTGTYTPEVYEHRGFIGLLFRDPVAGWCWRIIGEHGRVEPGCVWGNSTTDGDNPDVVRRKLMRELADRGWHPADGTEAPAFITVPHERQDFASYWQWQINYQVAQSIYDIENAEARRAFADARRHGKGFALRMAGLPDELTAQVERALDLAEAADGGHTLRVHSLRDIEAACSCGAWEMLAASFDRDSDDELRARINAKFIEHARYAQREAA